ncbi:MAG TPA: TetR-like C-terminal domain-containing protein [Stellaceae bacterium]|nr:TetR-like C-terminal domain-containing protein [Stellaceae bacterium]
MRRWLRCNVEFVATKKGMSAALALAVHGSSELYAYTFDRLTKAVGALLDRAVAAGEIRPDIGPEDLLRALVGMCYMHDQPGWQATVLRLVDVFVDGLCVQSSVNRQTTVVSRRGNVSENLKAAPSEPGSRKRRE